MCGICGLGYFVRHEQDWPPLEEPFHINAEDRGGGPFGGKPSYTVEGAAGALARAGLIWGNGPGAVVTFAFRDTGPTTMPDETSGFSRFNEAQIAQTLLALQSWSDLANITFNRVGGSGYSNDASILFSNYSSGAEGAAAFASLPGNTAASAANGDVWVNNSLWYNASPAYLNYGRHTLTHEIGHALGLLHPGDYDASEGDPTYADADYREDTRQFSIMSYWSESNTGAAFQGNYPSAPLLDDIAAIQLIYGANMSTRTGATTYGFNSNTGRDFYAATSSDDALIFAVWDAGGYDTLDFSGYSQNQVIDLRQGHFSNVGGLTGNVAIAQGAIIERAIGGSGNDVMYAAATPSAIAVADLVKTADHVINNSGVALSLDGAFGLAFDSEIVSSTAIPHATVEATGNGNYDWYRFTGQGGEAVTIDIDGTFGFDAVVRIVDANGAALASNDDGFRDVGSTNFQDSFLNFTLPASGVFYIVVGTYAGPGSDGFVDYAPVPAGASYTLNVSLSGAQIPDGYIMGSTLEGGMGDDTLTGNLGDDWLFGGDGNDVLDGRGGADRMVGGAGNDYYVFDNRGDRAVEEADGGIDTVRSTASISLHENVENLFLAGTGSIFAGGNGLNNRLVGNSGNNEIQGGAGDDRMEGGLGDDTFLVDSRNDKIVEFRDEGIDTVRSSQSWTLHTNLEHLTLIGSSNLYGGGNAKANIIIGNDGNNTLYGGALGDELKGGGGIDTFFYLAATDSTVESPDRILDLRFNEFIDLSGIDADSTVDGDQAFALVDEFSGAAGQMTLSYAADTATTTVLMDINGDGVADMKILLSGNHEDHAAWVF